MILEKISPLFRTEHLFYVFRISEKLQVRLKMFVLRVLEHFRSKRKLKIK